MVSKNRLSVEEREAKRQKNAERAEAQKLAAQKRHKSLQLEKKVNVCDYLIELTGFQDMSVAKVKQILSHEYTIITGNGQEKRVTIMQLINNASKRIKDAESVKKSNV